MKLQIYVSRHCATCGRSVALGKALASRYFGMDVEVVDLDDPMSIRPQDIFAVPTFLLDGRLLCLGNQDEDWLRRRVDAIQATQRGR